MAEPIGRPSPVLDLQVTRQGEIPVIGVSGELDMDTVVEIRAALDLTLAEAPPALVLDLSDVAFFSSSGLSLLLDIRRRVATFAVVATRRTVLRPLELTALAPLLAVFPTLAQALAWASSAQRVHHAD